MATRVFQRRTRKRPPGALLGRCSEGGRDPGCASQGYKNAFISHTLPPLSSFFQAEKINKCEKNNSATSANNTHMEFTPCGFQWNRRVSSCLLTHRNILPRLCSALLAGLESKPTRVRTVDPACLCSSLIKWTGWWSVSYRLTMTRW